MSFITHAYSRLVSMFGKRVVVTALAVTGILAVLALYAITKDATPLEETTADASRVVTLSNAKDLASGADTSLSIVGTVQSTREARLVTEAGGRVTRVNVTLGDTVAAGTVLASIENSRESAAVLQAQGAYEAAVAGANAGGASILSAERALTEAQNSAENTYRSAFTTSDTAVRNVIDRFFSNPEGAYPGLTIDGQGRAAEIAQTRVQIGSMLSTWRTSAATADSSKNHKELLAEAERNTTQVNALLTTLAALYSEDDAPPSDLGDGATALATARGQIDGVLAAITGARSGLNAAENALTQARIAGERGTVSASDAQIKQALGTLRLAQASYAKTIIRTPIAGTVQSLTLKEGTTVSIGTPAAVVSSEGSLEVVAYITEDDARMVSVGTEVDIEGGTKGIVTALASALDPITKKLEVRIGVTDGAIELTNGQTVTVHLTRTEKEDGGAVTLSLPIVALKMTPDGAVVFTVEDGKLVSHPVVLGAVSGDRVVIKEGLDPTWKIVTDARGLRAGESVEVKN